MGNTAVLYGACVCLFVLRLYLHSRSCCPSFGWLARLAEDTPRCFQSASHHHWCALRLHRTTWRHAGSRRISCQLWRVRQIASIFFKRGKMGGICALDHHGGRRPDFSLDTSLSLRAYKEWSNTTSWV